MGKTKYLLLLIGLTYWDCVAQITETSEGNVGIGISSPVEKLEIDGTAYFRSSPTYAVESEQIRFGRSDGNIRYHSIFSSHSGGAGSNYLQFRIHDQGENPFVSQKTVMTLYGNGYIGIGTTKVPSEMLEVNGTIKTKEVNVTVSGWADYVFKDDYQLMDLSELGAYITKNGHLPDVPTETEVMENGVNLTAMNVKLLEKVEELTLYVLELRQRNEEQDEMIRTVFKRISNEK